MFCNQCEQTNRTPLEIGCTIEGNCGKSANVAVLQDLLIYTAKAIAWTAHRARQLGASDKEVNTEIFKLMFSTLTNVNFDVKRLQSLLKKGDSLFEKISELYHEACQKKNIIPEVFNDISRWRYTDNLPALINQAKLFEALQKRRPVDKDVASLRSIILFGLKGVAAYADHAQILGFKKEDIDADYQSLLAYLVEEPTDINDLLTHALAVGELNYRALALLNQANTETYGQPEPTKVRTTPIKGKAIVVSGHDLKDLYTLLEQTKDKDIHVYTHGEMLPAHAYPGLKKYKHLVGHFGSAWQNQQEEFPLFPGAILMTTNCIQEPAPNYQARIFTTGLVAWPNVQHISNGDFSLVIEAALNATGFTEEGDEKYITVGFGQHAVLSAANEIIQAVKQGAIKHFFLIGGCDGSKPERSYYTEFASMVPNDCLILTLGCGKYKINHLELGNIGAFPRLLDMGQCNDAYSALQVALALADAFKCGVNELPLSLVLSWYEQKAVAILLTLLYLGVKNIRLGPSLPAFVSANVLKVLQDKFNLMLISTPEKDLQDILAT